MKKVYVAIPYTGDEDNSFKLANQVAGDVINEGNVPFSPISMTHPIALECEIKGNWETWERIDYVFIDWCDEVLVVNYDNERTEKSVGVQAEIAYAKKQGKTIRYKYPRDEKNS